MEISKTLYRGENTPKHDATSHELEVKIVIGCSDAVLNPGLILAAVVESLAATADSSGLASADPHAGFTTYVKGQLVAQRPIKKKRTKLKATQEA